MVDKIYALKNEILKRTNDEIHERGIERMDVKEVGELVDMVKDLAEAEAYCWKAEYYRTVTDAMKGEKSGYTQMSGGRSGYQGGESPVETLRSMLKNSGPDEREKLRNEVRSMIGAM